MQKNFSQYVADVELQKLDLLTQNLGNVFAIYDDWGNAIQAQILQIEGDAGPDDYDRLSRGWLRRQYDIALQQRYFKEQTLLHQSESNTIDSLKVRPVLNSAELAIIQQNLPSQYQPFEGLRFPLLNNRNLVRRLDQNNNALIPPFNASAPISTMQAELDASHLRLATQATRNPLLPPLTPAQNFNLLPANPEPLQPKANAQENAISLLFSNDPNSTDPNSVVPNSALPNSTDSNQASNTTTEADVLRATDAEASTVASLTASAASSVASSSAVTTNNSQRSNNPNQKQFISLPDRLGLSSRLGLYDTKQRFVVGEPATNGVSFRPIVVNNQVVGYLGLKPVLEQDDALSINFFSQQKRYLLFIYAASFLASLVAALLLATYFKAPIQRLLHATKALARGSFEHQVAIKRNDELGDLSQQLNKLAKMLNQHEQSRRQWVADTSHELKTPLAVLQAQIEALQDGIREATPQHLLSMMSQVQSLKKLTQDLSDLAQADALQLRCYVSLMDPWPLVEQQLADFQVKFDQANLLVSSHGQGCELALDADRFKQIVVNLLSNSVRYTLAHGKIDVTTEQTAAYWRLCIDDSPLGLTDQQLQHLGERFYRVDDSRTRGTGGTGLGLALSCKLAQAMGGQLCFKHSALGGLRVELTFYFKTSSS